MSKLSDKVYGIIYKIENKVNGKVYIGQTTQRGGFDYRYGKLWWENTHNIHLKRAVEKYGVENFEVTKVLKKCYSETSLNKSESKYIKQYDSTNPSRGYNKTTGGDNHKLSEETVEKMRKNIKAARDNKKILRAISVEEFDGVVNIHKSEWDNICKLDNEKLMKVAFILLISYKMYRHKYNTNFISFTKDNIRKECSLRGENDILDSFLETEYVNILKSDYDKSVKCELNYIDEISDILIIIDNFKNVITYFYELYKGWKYKECVECGKRIRINVGGRGGRPKKYCTSCAKIVNTRKQKERNRKKKENN